MTPDSVLIQSSVDPAVDALRALLTHLLSWPQREWIEKVFVDFVWLLQSSNHPSRERLDIARGVVETLEEHGVPSLSMEAAHAALIVRQSLMHIFRLY